MLNRHDHFEMKTIFAMIPAMALSACTVTVGLDGKPRLALDPEAAGKAVEEINRQLTAREEETEIEIEK